MQKVFQKSHLKLGAVILPVGLGLTMAIFDFLEYQEGLASVNWVPTHGKILSNSIKAERPARGRMIFIPTVAYSYHISEDEALRGTRMTFPDRLPAPEKDLKKLLQRVEIGQAVTAYYDPRNTAHVTLFRGVRRSRYVVAFLKDAAVASAALFVWALLFPRPRK